MKLNDKDKVKLTHKNPDGTGIGSVQSFLDKLKKAKIQIKEINYPYGEDPTKKLLNVEDINGYKITWYRQGDSYVDAPALYDKIKNYFSEPKWLQKQTRNLLEHKVAIGLCLLSIVLGSVLGCLLNKFF